jgi:hypothetical protein
MIMSAERVRPSNGEPFREMTSDPATPPRANGTAEPAPVAKQNGKPSLGRRRLEWVDAVGGHVPTGKVTDFDCRVAGRLAWRFINHLSGETFGDLVEWAAHVGADERSVRYTIRRLCAAGLLVQIARHAPGRPNKYRIAFPDEAPQPQAAVTPAEGQKREAAKPKAKLEAAPAPTTWAEYETHVQGWLYAEMDTDVIKARWKCDAERAIRSECCKGDIKYLEKAHQMFKERLEHGNLSDRSGRADRDDEIPF